MHPGLNPHFAIPQLKGHDAEEVDHAARTMLERTREFNHKIMAGVFEAIAEVLELGEDGMTEQIARDMTIEVAKDGVDTVKYKGRPILRVGPVEFTDQCDGLSVKVLASRTIERVL